MRKRGFFEVIMFLLSIPHSGEKIPDSCTWLSGLPKEIFLADVDRFVDELYRPFIQKYSIDHVIAPYHRYVVDLNRDPEDVDQSSVQGALLAPGTHSHGFHWVTTMGNFKLLPNPLSQEEHLFLKKLIYDSYHESIQSLFLRNKASQKAGQEVVWLLDLHSMPSVGTTEHRDPGQLRADVVISDNQGQSAQPGMVDAVLSSFVRAGFKVAYNWPYLGGKITTRYGRPYRGWNAVQIELNRALYMDEVTKEPKRELWPALQVRLTQAMEGVYRAYWNRPWY